MKIRTPAQVKALFDGDAENLLVAMTHGGIEAQEARGQDRFVHSDLLPKEINGWVEGLGDRDTHALCERLGIKVLGDADDLFYAVELPQGWTKEATGHSMWSSIFDERGRKRMSVFYKAAFYDRRAFVNVECRYRATYTPVGGFDALYAVSHEQQEDFPFVALALDGETVIWQSEQFNQNKIPSWDLSAMAAEWLNANRPNWRDEFAYWDEA